MTDLIKLHLQAGDGGNGRVAFRREKYVPKGGPAGGNGGNGGKIILRGTRAQSSLAHLAGVKEFVAKRGQSGGKQKRTGSKGADVVIEVPVGTRVWLLAENQISARREERYGLGYLLNRDEVGVKKYFLAAEGQAIPAQAADEVVELKSKRQLFEVTQDGEEVVVCQGGFGGRGNNTFKGPANTTPLEAEYGSWGEQKTVELEQLLLADVGLVGFPNAGKSTLISVLTEARPKVGNYPFTTLEPHLGIMRLEGEKPSLRQEIVIADIPGLIEGASQGKGLGHDFLRHIEHCGLLLFVLYLPEEVVFDQTLSDKKRAKYLWEQLEKLRLELQEYGAGLEKKPVLIGVNKLDLYSPELVREIRALFAKKKQAVVLFSGATQAGVEELRSQFYFVSFGEAEGVASLVTNSVLT